MVKILLSILTTLTLLPGFSRAQNLMDILGEEVNDSEETVLPVDSDIMLIQKSFGSLSAEQNILFDFLKKGQFNKGLYQFPSAFPKPFKNLKDTEKALYGLILFKNGLKINGVEKLFEVSRPKEIHTSLIKLWKEELHKGSDIYDLVEIKWTPEWESIFDMDLAIKFKTPVVIRNGTDEEIQELLKQSKPGTKERQILTWHALINLGVNGGEIKAAKLLKTLLNQKNKVFSEDLINLTAARLLYQKGFLTQAIQYYKKIEKKSPFWFTAQEELSWAYIRMGRPQDSIATTRTLVMPEFMQESSPEAFYVRSLGLLKVCDYPEIAVLLKDFKVRFKNRVIQLGEIEKTPQSNEIKEVVSVFSNGKVNSKIYSKFGVKSLPRHLHLDQFFLARVKAYKKLKEEEDKAERVYLESIEAGTSQVGLAGPLKKFSQDVRDRARRSYDTLLSHVSRLAKEEREDIRVTLTKLQVVEAEVLQQLIMAEAIIQKQNVKEPDQKVGTTGGNKGSVLKFPVEKEIWFDEIANYRVNLKKGCQAIKAQ